MSLPFSFEALQWRGRGYFLEPVAQEDKSEPDYHLSLQAYGILVDARAGRYGRTERLLDIYNQTASTLLSWTCSQMLGDIAHGSLFMRMMQEVDDSLDPERAADYCNAFASWGSLSAVPTILESLHRYHGWQDTEVLPGYLSVLMEPEWGPIAEYPSSERFDDYYDHVMQSYEELKHHYGTDQVLLLQGERSGVIPLARRMLHSLGMSVFEKTMQPFYRRRFEASTGIDCSCFYQEREFQPLTAAALLEEFLESPEAARYEDGVRYFFGHRIPE